MKRLTLTLVLALLATLATAQVITVTTDGPIVNSPAVHGLITVTDTTGHSITMHAGFKIRGTSSQQYDKKSYRVELWADASGSLMADTSFLGMRSDDDWNLEAMWAQPLRLRDKVANQLWMEMYQLPYAESEPEARAGIRMEYADLYLNGEYQGVYALTERVDRKQLALRKYNGNLRGVLYKGNGAGAPTFDELPDFDNTSDTWGNYEWVYPNEADTAINWSQLYAFTNFVINASDVVFYSQYPAQFDKTNAVFYYLFVNSLMAMDNMGRNLFVARYKKSGTYFYIPWDLDAVWGLDTEGHRTYNTAGLAGNGFYDRLLSDCYEGGFVAQAQACYDSLRLTVLNTEHIMSLVQAQYDYLLSTGAYAREHEAWPSFSVDASQLDYLRWWLDARFAWLDRELHSACGSWSVPEVPEPVEGPSAEGLSVQVYPNPAKDCLHIRLTVPSVPESVPESVGLRLYDMTGRLVYANATAAQAFDLPAQGFSQGIYTLLVQANGKQQVKRVVVE